MTLLMRAVDIGEFQYRSLTPGGICLVFVIVGIHRSLELQRFFIAIAGAVVNDDGSGGSSVNPCAWSAGAETLLSSMVQGAKGCDSC